MHNDDPFGRLVKGKPKVYMAFDLEQLDILSDALETWSNHHDDLIKDLENAGTSLLLKDATANHRLLKTLQRRVKAKQEQLYST